MGRYLDTVLMLHCCENGRIIRGGILDQIIEGTRIPFESGARPYNDLLVDVIMNFQ